MTEQRFIDEAKAVTKKHIQRVRDLMADMCGELRSRAMDHDRSKFEQVELLPLADMQELIAKEGQAPYGTDEYKRRTALLGPMIKHHHENNTHHPEHYPNGIAGFDVLDLLEMVCDWKAASERGGDDAVNLSYSIEKFGIEPQLASILANTFARQGWAVK